MPRKQDSNPLKRPVVGKSTQRSRVSESGDAAKAPALPLPHERDQSTRRKEHPVEAVIDQAKRDVDSGQQDTDQRGRAGEIFDRRWSGRGTLKS